MAKHNNVVRFYVDDNDNITKCDFFEEKEYLERNPVNLSSEALRRLFQKYMSDDNIYHEEKIFNNVILFKFYDVDKYELSRLISNEEFVNKYATTTKFKDTKPVRSQNTKPRKVNRKNKFNGKVVIVSAVTLGILLGFAINMSVKDTTHTNTPSKEGDEIVTIFTQDDRYRPIKMGPVSIDNTNVVQIPDEPLEPIENIEQNDDVYDQLINIEADDWTDTEKYAFAKENYYDLITKYANMYGIDPKIALAIACHERGKHSSEVDPGGGIGLYQIQIEGTFNWDNQEVNAYNFETQSNEKVIVHKDDVRNLEQNIKVGLMIFQESLRRNDYDIARAIQEYNYGYGNLRDVINKCYTSNNPLTDDNRLEWLNYRGIIKGGDPYYIENIFKYVEDESVLEFKEKDGTIITCKYDNLLKGPQLK